MAFESYNAYLANTTTVADNPNEYFKQSLQAVSDSVFDIASDAYTIKHRSRITNQTLADTPVWTDVRARLVRPYEIKQTNLIKDDLFNLVFKDFDYVALLGDIFEFNGYRWIVINTSLMRSVTSSVLVQRCNAKLRFTESTPLSSNVIEIDALASKLIFNSLKENQFITLPDNEMLVQIPNDYLGVKIKWSEKGGTRFLLGQPYQNWRAIGFDNISLNRVSQDGLTHSGIIKLNMQLSQLNKGLDDEVNGVAWQDYF